MTRRDRQEGDADRTRQARPGGSGEARANLRAGKEHVGSDEGKSITRHTHHTQLSSHARPLHRVCINDRGTRQEWSNKSILLESCSCRSTRGSVASLDVFEMQRLRHFCCMYSTVRCWLGVGQSNIVVAWPSFQRHDLDCLLIRFYSSLLRRYTSISCIHVPLFSLVPCSLPSSASRVILRIAIWPPRSAAPRRTVSLQPQYVA